MIGAARPDDTILGEESGIDGPAGAARTWLVDPLCGMLNYAAQTPLARGQRGRACGWTSGGSRGRRPAGR
jgi:hypothetical protein